jgi:hypothetical protein
MRLPRFPDPTAHHLVLGASAVRRTSESLTLLVLRLSIISGKWKVLLKMPGFIWNVSHIVPTARE